MQEKGVRILIADKDWPQLLAQSCHMGVEALRRADVDFKSITTQMARIIEEPTEEGLFTGWQVDLIGECQEARCESS